MKIFVAPLNWGLGHAGRCVPLVRGFLAEGHEVVLGGDGESLTLLKQHFPSLRVLPLAPLHLRYSKGKRQVWAMARQIPSLIHWAIADHRLMQYYQQQEHFDRILSDNRFGLYVEGAETIYMTHQLHIMLPHGWRWAEPIAERWHRHIAKRYTRCWVPDYPSSIDTINPSLFQGGGEALAGALSHPAVLPKNVEYIGPLSRFRPCQTNISSADTINFSPFKGAGGALALLSGLEPQRTIFEQEILSRFVDNGTPLLLVQGKVGVPKVRIKRGNITIVPHLNDEELIAALTSADRIICRSGYSTLMDLSALGLLDKAELHATPGQPEQEYLAALHAHA